MKLYLASSWRNKKQPDILWALRGAGHEVYDFRNPGFLWSDIDPNWEKWDPENFRRKLFHPLAMNGFNQDFNAMKWAEACVLLMPCGRSAHLEAGYFIGADKILIVLLSDGEPELMYKMATDICISEKELIHKLSLYKEE